MYLCNTFSGVSGITVYLLNQARTGLWPALAWFLKIDPVWIVGIHVCVSAPKTVNNWWHDVA